jgi:hypothetical protein
MSCRILSAQYCPHYRLPACSWVSPVVGVQPQCLMDLHAFLSRCAPLADWVQFRSWTLLLNLSCLLQSYTALSMGHAVEVGIGFADRAAVVGAENLWILLIDMVKSLRPYRYLTIFSTYHSIYVNIC